ncbi:thioesterase II family protein [Streptomyces sp. NPDC088733]|uniref:thioesterase II family protein n=1 Tax=Streptomyces sp. NPDC088733 TaxID=3365880 RepID=UPI0038210D99
MHTAANGTWPSPWFRQLRNCPAPRLRLLCFPHAGGAANFFRPWSGLVPDDVELLAVRYPGREDRFAEPPARSMEELAEPIAQACAGLADRPLVFFGHSMGASVAFEVAARLAAGPLAPGLAALCVSGRPGPGKTRSRGLADATDEELVADLVSMSGTNAEALASPELRELFLPMIRADYRLLDRYGDHLAPGRLDVPVVAYYGDQDEHVDEDAVNAWSAVTRSGFAARSFPGGHFYLEQHAAPLLADLFARLDTSAPQATSA